MHEKTHGKDSEKQSQSDSDKELDATLLMAFANSHGASSRPDAEPGRGSNSRSTTYHF
jgi:hypothetical protein